MNSRAQKIYSFIAILTCFYIPFMSYAMAVGNILMLILLSIFIFYGLKKLEFLNKKLLIFLLLLIAYIFISSFFRQTFQDDFDYLTKLTQGFLLFFLFYCVKDVKNMINAFVYATFISALITCINILYKYFNSSNFLLLGNDILSSTFTMQRLYLGFYVVIALILTLYKRSTSNNIKENFFNNFLILFFISSLFLFSSRSAIIIAFIVMLVLFKKAFVRKNYKLIYISLSLIFMVLAINYQTLYKRVFYGGDVLKSSIIDEIKIHEPRYDIWRFSFEVLNENKSYLWGLGPKTSKDYLLQKYSQIEPEKRRNWFLTRQFNTHNQYLDILLSYGLFGLFLFLIFIYELLNIVRRNPISLCLVLSLVLFLFIENIFHRQFGLFIFSLAIAWAINLTKDNYEKNIGS